MVPLQIYEDGVMSVNLSIKNVPDQLAEMLRQRAVVHHRSLQGELMAILENAVVSPTNKLTAAAVLAQVRESGISTPAEAVDMVRADRDAGR